MNKLIEKYITVFNLKVLAALAVCISIFLHYFVGYPQAMSYHEQSQLFLWTSDYFCESIIVPGGLKSYVGEFLVQFYYVEWLGALIIALLFVALQSLTLCLLPQKRPYVMIALSFIPVFVMLYLMGDENVLLSMLVALLLVMSSAALLRKVSIYYDIIIIPLLYWIAGPMVWLYALLCIVLNRKWIYIATLVYIATLQLVAYNTILRQWPLHSVMMDMGYYRYPDGVAMLEPGFETDKYELINQDYLIRNERWNEVLANAEKRTIQNAFWSNCVNLSLAMTGQLAQRQFEFYQSGPDALLMPMVRDMNSNSPTMEAFYRLGMINECLRYAFDLQESIPYGKKSGRLSRRIAECCIINGNYKVARKYLNLLKHTLFYAEWAKDAEAYLGNEAKIDSHPVWGHLRKMHYKTNLRFSYEEKYKMLGQLLSDNTENKMALEYFFAELLVRGDVESFMKYLQWAEMYGNYSSIPSSYSDALQCIQAQGYVPGCRYAEYAKRMHEEGARNEGKSNNESAH